MNTEFFTRCQGKQFLLIYTSLPYHGTNPFNPYIQITGIIEGTTDIPGVIPCKKYTYKEHRHPSQEPIIEEKEGDVVTFNERPLTDKLIKVMFSQMEMIAEEDEVGYYEFSRPSGISVRLLIADNISAEWYR